MGNLISLIDDLLLRVELAVVFMRADIRCPIVKRIAPIILTAVILYIFTCIDSRRACCQLITCGGIPADPSCSRCRKLGVCRYLLRVIGFRGRMVSIEQIVLKHVIILQSIGVSTISHVVENIIVGIHCSGMPEGVKIINLRA